MANSNKKKRAGGLATMRISKRVVNRKRHVQGYMINGRFYSTVETSRLASQGKINGVRRVGRHVQSQVGRRALTSLPTVIR